MQFTLLSNNEICIDSMVPINAEEKNLLTNPTRTGCPIKKLYTFSTLNFRSSLNIYTILRNIYGKPDSIAF